MSFGRLGTLGTGFGRLGAALGGAGGAAYDAASQLIFDSFTTPPSTQRKTDIDTLVRALKADGIWSLLDVLYVTAAADNQAAGINWKSPGTFTAIVLGTPAFVADRGYTGSASNALNTNYIPASDGVN